MRLQRNAVDLGQRLVDADEAEGAVELRQAERRRAVERLEIGKPAARLQLAPHPRCRRGVLRREVVMRAAEDQRHPRRVALQHLAAGQHGDPAPVGMAQAKLHLVAAERAGRMRIGGHMRIGGDPQLCPVVRMDQGLPDGHRHRLHRRQAEHGAPAGRDLDQVGPQVALPGAQFGPGQRDLEPPVRGRQPRLGAGAGG